jgi:hypothetical protein
MSSQPTKADLLIGRYSANKVETIVKAAYDAFYKLARDYESLSADEIFAIGYNFLYLVMVQSLEKMSSDPHEMRVVLGQQIALMLERGQEQGN